MAVARSRPLSRTALMSVFACAAAFSLSACGASPQQTIDALNKCNEDYRALAEKMAQGAGQQVNQNTPCPVCPAGQNDPNAGVIVTTDFNGLEAAVTQAGFRVLDRQPKFLVVDYNGLKARLYTQGKNAQLYAAFVGANPPMDAINEWNKSKRFSRAYVDSDGDPVIESDVDLEGGVTHGAVVEWVRTFNLSIRAFAKMLVETEKRSTL
jgi:hypothetical protein